MTTTREEIKQSVLEHLEYSPEWKCGMCHNTAEWLVKHGRGHRPNGEPAIPYSFQLRCTACIEEYQTYFDRGDCIIITFGNDVVVQWQKDMGAIFIVCKEPL